MNKQNCINEQNTDFILRKSAMSQQDLNAAFCTALRELSVQMNSVIKALESMMSFYEANFENMALDIAITAKVASKLVGVSESKLNKDYRKGFLHKVTINGKRGFSKNEILQKYQ